MKIHYLIAIISFLGYQICKGLPETKININNQTKDTFPYRIDDAVPRMTVRENILSGNFVPGKNEITVPETRGIPRIYITYNKGKEINKILFGLKDIALAYDKVLVIE